MTEQLSRRPQSISARARCVALLAAIGMLALPAPGRADFPYPRCEDSPRCSCSHPDALPDCSDDPSDYASYLFLEPGELPDDYGFDPENPDSGSGWKYQGVIEGGPADGIVGGMNVVEAWQTTTGRPDVVVGVIDSGIEWDRNDLFDKVALRLSELPMPADADPPEPCVGEGYDCNGDGAVSVRDFAGILCEGLGGSVRVTPDLGPDGLDDRLDGQDLLVACSDGFDGYGANDDGNGYVDDIAGWDFQDDDNDAFDDVRYGHGSGEAQNQASEANNGSGFPGVAPNELFLPLKVADSFVAVGTDFAQAVVYAADWPTSAISEALGTVSAGPVGQQAIDYAYAKGIPLIASAADEQSRHHNWPAAYDHTIWMNSILQGDGDLIHGNDEVPPNPGFDILNGCTNHGGKAWTAIPSTGCSSEATGRAGGVTGLIISHGKNLIDRGELTPYPGLDAPFSAEEVRQIFRFMAEDIDHGDDLDLILSPLAGQAIRGLLAPPGFPFEIFVQHFPAGPGWDQYTGYGRPNVARLADLSDTTIPPEADLSGNIAWFDILDPDAGPIGVVGTARAVRAPGFTYTLSVGCGVEPQSFTEIESAFSLTSLELAVLGTWDVAATEIVCGYDASAPMDEPDQRAVTLLLEVDDTLGNHGEDRRTVALDSDPSLAFAPIDLRASGEGSPALADVDRDGDLEILYGTAAGEVHAIDGRTGRNLPGFPAHTLEIPVHADDPSSGFGSGAVDVPREALGASLAADDLDGDGRVEIVGASFEGRVYVWDDHGALRAGFPVSTDPAFSDPAARDGFNDADPGFIASPTLVDLDGPGGNPDLEIVVGSMDGHLYAWHVNGESVAGFPVRLADPSRVTIDPATGRAEPIAGSMARERGRKIVGSPGVGDIDGDGFIEIIAGTTEEYGGHEGLWKSPSNVFEVVQALLPAFDLGSFDLDVASRVYAVNHDGSFVPGWPVAAPQLIAQLLPSVATGTSGSMVLADVVGDARPEVVIHSFAGPALVVDGSGQSVLPEFQGTQRPLAIDFPGLAPNRPAPGFPAVPDTAGTFDAPFFPALGSGAFGDIDGDGRPEFVSPTAGIRKLLDVLFPGNQFPGFHQIAAWNPEDGSLLPFAPMPMDDMQFIANPGIADVTGDGAPDVINGSGVYLVHAYELLPDGSAREAEGWPKFTHGWVISSPTAGDVDGDGLIEVVVATREGRLFVWDTPAPASESAIEWQGFGGDRRNSQNYDLAVSPLAEVPDPLAGLLWTLEDIEIGLSDAMGLRATRPRERSFARFATRSVAASRHALEEVLAGERLGPTGFPRTLLALGGPPPRDAEPPPVYHQFLEALGEAAARQVGAVVCDPGDVACERCSARAEARLERADERALAGRDPLAVAAWERTIRIARRCGR